MKNNETEIVRTCYYQNGWKNFPRFRNEWKKDKSLIMGDFEQWSRI